MYILSSRKIPRNEGRLQKKNYSFHKKKLSVCMNKYCGAANNHFKLKYFVKT